MEDEEEEDCSIPIEMDANDMYADDMDADDANDIDEDFETTAATIAVEDAIASEEMEETQVDEYPIHSDDEAAGTPIAAETPIAAGTPIAAVAFATLSRCKELLGSINTYLLFIVEVDLKDLHAIDRLLNEMFSPRD